MSDLRVLGGFLNLQFRSPRALGGNIWVFSEFPLGDDWIKAMGAASAANTGNSEVWVGELEPHENNWGFTVFGPHNEPLSHFESGTREQAERAREVMFAALESKDDDVPTIPFARPASH